MTWLLQVIKSAYAAYILGFTGIFAGIEYDRYRMRTICTDMAARHNPDGDVTHFLVMNTFLCPYNTVYAFKRDAGSTRIGAIARERHVTVPAVLAVPTEYLVYDRRTGIVKKEY